MENRFLQTSMDQTDKVIDLAERAIETIKELQTIVDHVTYLTKTIEDDAKLGATIRHVFTTKN